MFVTRLLITGANGLLGQALVRQLGRSSEFTVLATARDDAPRFESGICDYRRVDVTAPEDVTSVFEDFAPDVVINCAAMSDVTACEHNRNEAWAVNARAVKRLAKKCRETRTRLVQLSSDFVFNGKRGPYEEDARPDPVNYYGRTKLAGENAVREAGRESWAIARTVLLYGTGHSLSRPNAVLWMIDELSKGNPIHVVDDQYRTPTHVDDLAAGIERLVLRDATGIYHLSGRELVTIHELAQQVADVFDFDPSLIHAASTDSLDEEVIRPRRTGFVILKAETELDYDPRSLEEGLRDLRQTLNTAPVSSR